MCAAALAARTHTQPGWDAWTCECIIHVDVVRCVKVWLHLAWRILCICWIGHLAVDTSPSLLPIIRAGFILVKRVRVRAHQSWLAESCIPHSTNGNTVRLQMGNCWMKNWTCNISVYCIYTFFPYQKNAIFLIQPEFLGAVYMQLCVCVWVYSEWILFSVCCRI